MYPIFSLIQTCRRGDRKDIEVRDKDRERDKERSALESGRKAEMGCESEKGERERKL